VQNTINKLNKLIKKKYYNTINYIISYL